MSYLWNVISMKCPIYEMSYLKNVLSKNVLSMKCPIYEVSYLWNVLSMKSPIYEMSYLLKCPIYTMSFYKMSQHRIIWRFWRKHINLWGIQNHNRIFVKKIRWLLEPFEYQSLKFSEIYRVTLQKLFYLIWLFNKALLNCSTTIIYLHATLNWWDFRDNLTEFILSVPLYS